jgi:AcrR family transcriptional regulator
MKSPAKTILKKSGRTRGYDASARREAAESTRRTILESARAMFCEKGYVGTSMQAIAEAAGIALDTVYASVGKKPALFALLVETAISGSDIAIPAEERDYVRAIRAEADASRKLAIYASALRSIQERLAPLFRVLQEAAPLDARLGELWNGIAERRARNMRLLAKDLEETGRLRRDLSIDTVADVLWTMNSPEYYLLLVEGRGWEPAKFEKWLKDSWCRLLLEQSA